MKTIKHTLMSDCPSVVIKLDAEQMLYRTDKDGFYIHAEAQFKKEGTIRGLNELLEIEVNVEGVDDGIALLRVWAVEYTVSEEQGMNVGELIAKLQELDPSKLVTIVVGDEDENIVDTRHFELHATDEGVEYLEFFVPVTLPLK